ncbi:hypothetical protein P4O66_016650 [Electrophorus voltai]|uniref:Uncharacterized protein n=1 Tax=Electrophorus voltai TaxID=2609070 RepID=A0AAD9DMJ6_9TELE|nr:hypothetical protein P4O66_016650 [Electrophorus voltai]
MTAAPPDRSIYDRAEEKRWVRDKGRKCPPGPSAELSRALLGKAAGRHPGFVAPPRDPDTPSAAYGTSCLPITLLTTREMETVRGERKTRTLTSSMEGQPRTNDLLLPRSGAVSRQPHNKRQLGTQSHRQPDSQSPFTPLNAGQPIPFWDYMRADAWMHLSGQLRKGGGVEKKKFDAQNVYAKHMKEPSGTSNEAIKKRRTENPNFDSKHQPACKRLECKAPGCFSAEEHAPQQGTLESDSPSRAHVGRRSSPSRHACVLLVLSRAFPPKQSSCVWVRLRLTYGTSSVPDDSRIRWLRSEIGSCEHRGQSSTGKREGGLLASPRTYASANRVKVKSSLKFQACAFFFLPHANGSRLASIPTSRSSILVSLSRGTVQNEDVAPSLGFTAG